MLRVTYWIDIYSKLLLRILGEEKVNLTVVNIIFDVYIFCLCMSL